MFNICCVVKNLSANKKVKRELLKLEYLQTLNRYLRIWNEEKSIGGFGTSILVQITSAYRHLVAEEKSYALFSDENCNCFGAWISLVEKFPTSNDLIFNLLRILSKLSSYQDFCQKLNKKKKCLQTLSNFFKMYKSQIHIVIRISFIFAYLVPNIGTSPPTFQTSAISSTLTSTPGLTSSLASNTTPTASWRGRVRWRRWESAWPHGITRPWKNSQMWRHSSKSLDLSPTSSQFQK